LPPMVTSPMRTQQVGRRLNFVRSIALPVFRPAFARRYRKGNTKKADRSMCCGLPGFILSVIPSRCLRDRDTG